jgi:chromosome segregation ATPase
LRQAQSAAFAAAQDLTRIRNEITALDLQKQGNSIRLEKLSAEKIQLEEERTRLESRLQEFTASVEVEKLNAQTKRGSVEQRQNRLRELQVELQAIVRRAGQFLQQQAEKRSRLTCWSSLKARTKVSTPARSRRCASRARSSARSRTASACRTNLSWRLKMRSAINLQLVLTEQPESAQEILADLSTRTNPAARASRRWPSSNTRTKSSWRLKAKWRRAKRAAAQRPDAKGQIVHA